MYTIEKTFDGIDLAHRVDTQQLDCEFTEGNSCELKCRRFHGHSAKILVKLGAEVLHNHMVMDYNELGFLKKLIKNHLDHHTLINEGDPLFKFAVGDVYTKETGEPRFKLDEVVEYSTKTGMKMYTINLDEHPVIKTSEDLGAWFRAMTIVNFPTTSENICKWLYGIIRQKVIQFNNRHLTNVKVISVGYKETENSLATYSED